MSCKVCCTVPCVCQGKDWEGKPQMKGVDKMNTHHHPGCTETRCHKDCQITTEEVSYAVKKSIMQKLQKDIKLIRNPIVDYSSSHIVMLKNVIDNMVSKAKEIDELLENLVHPFGKGGSIDD